MSQEPPVKISVPPETSIIEKLALVTKDVETVIEFLQGTSDELGHWVACVPSYHGNLQDFIYCKENQHFTPRTGSQRDLVLRAYGIDPVGLEVERRSLLNYYRPEDKG